MRRRDFVQWTASGLMGAPLLGVTLLHKADLLAAEADAATDGSDLFLTEPYLQKPGMDEITVRWITAKPCDCWVEYGATPELGEKAFDSIDGLKTTGRIQEVTLSGLKPGTEYFYRIASREIQLHEAYNVKYGEPAYSPVKTFTTFATDKDRTQFIVLNDIHNQPSFWKSLVEGVSDFPYEFAMLNGDIMSYITDENHLIQDVLRPAGEIFGGRTPFYYVRGNHEARGVFSRELKNYLTTDGNKYYYAQTIGPVRLIVLDSGEDKSDESKGLLGLADFEPYREVQRLWLEKEIASPEFQKAKYRVVVHHIPPLPNEPWAKKGQMWEISTEKWLPVYKKSGIDLLIAGHTHKYSIDEPTEERPYTLMVGGGPKKGEATVMKIDADQNRLEATMVRDDGQVVGHFTIPAKS